MSEQEKPKREPDLAKLLGVTDAPEGSGVRTARELRSTQSALTMPPVTLESIQAVMDEFDAAPSLPPFVLPLTPIALEARVEAAPANPFTPMYLGNRYMSEFCPSRYLTTDVGEE